MILCSVAQIKVISSDCVIFTVCIFSWLSVVQHIPVERVVDVFEGVEEKVIDKHIEVDVPEYREIPRYVEVPQVIYRFVPVEKIVEVPIDVPVEGPPQQLTFDLLHHRTRSVYY